MSDMLANYITAGSTLALFFATVVLAFLTWALWKEAKKSREQELEPNIVVSIEPASISTFHAMLVIENVGKGVAYNVKIHDKNNSKVTTNNGDYYINEYPFMSSSIIKPGQKIEHLLTSFDNLKDVSMNFEISSENINAKKFINSNCFEANFLYGRITFEIKSLDNVARSLEEISRSLISVIKGNYRLEVNSFDKEDRLAEKEKQAAYLASVKKKQTS